MLSVASALSLYMHNLPPTGYRKKMRLGRRRESSASGQSRSPRASSRQLVRNPCVRFGHLRRVTGTRAGGQHPDALHRDVDAVTTHILLHFHCISHAHTYHALLCSPLLSSALLCLSDPRSPLPSDVVLEASARLPVQTPPSNATSCRGSEAIVDRLDRLVDSSRS